MKFSIGAKITLLMTFAVLIVIATGYLSYKSLSSIVNSIDVKVRPDTKLEQIKEISSELDKAENRIRLYMITDNQRALSSYFALVRSVDRMVDTLRTGSMGDEKLIRQIDTLHSLIQQKKKVWHEMLLLSNNDEINAQYEEIEKVLKEEETDTLPVLAEQPVPDTVSVVPEKPLETADDRNFFQKLFGKKKETRTNHETAEKPVIRQEPEPEAELPVLEKIPEIDKQAIQERIKRLKELDSQKQLQVKEKELELAQTGNEITSRFYRFVEELEKDEFAKNRERIETADQLAEQTYKWLALFSISGTLLAILVILTLFRYTRKSKAYQKALENSKAEAEKLAKTRELFMANVSHEIRTPLNAISGFTENLIKRTKNEGISGELRIIKSANDQLLRMMNDLLDFSKLQSDKVKLDFAYFSLKKTFEEVYNLFRYQAKEQKIMFFYHIDEEVADILYGDQYRLKQILINLINNALKFTKTGQVSFIAENHRQFGKKMELKIVVQDSGIGIEKEKLSVIFDEFIQADVSFSRKFGGTGLGLSIVKKLLDLHKGKIEVESHPGTGTMVTILIPYETGDERNIIFEEQNEIIIPGQLKGKQILIVDDTEYNRLLLRKILKNHHFNTQEATNGNEALEQVKEKKFDMILMDIRMPDLDGYKVTRFIRNTLKYSLSVLPVIAISATFSDEDVKKGEAAGINRFLSKPFTEETLLITIIELFGFHAEGHIKTVENPVETAGSRLNIKELYRISGNENSFVIEMLEKFIDVTDKGLKEIGKELTGNHIDQVIEMAHKLAPPCRHIGAMMLYNCLKEIEFHKEKDAARLFSLYSDAGREFELIKKEIESFLSKIVPSST